MSSYLGEGDDNKAAEVEKFIHYLELNRDTVFADAVDAIDKSRQERLRMPEQRADETQVIALKMHTERKIKALSDDYEIVTRKTYIELRDAILQQIDFVQCTPRWRAQSTETEELVRCSERKVD